MKADDVNVRKAETLKLFRLWLRKMTSKRKLFSLQIILSELNDVNVNRMKPLNFGITLTVLSAPLTVSRCYSSRDIC